MGAERSWELILLRAAGPLSQPLGVNWRCERVNIRFQSSPEQLVNVSDKRKEEGKKKIQFRHISGHIWIHHFYKLRADVPLINIQRLRAQFCEDEEWITRCSISPLSLASVGGSGLKYGTQGNNWTWPGEKGNTKVRALRRKGYLSKTDDNNSKIIIYQLFHRSCCKKMFTTQRPRGSIISIILPEEVRDPNVFLSYS